MENYIIKKLMAQNAMVPHIYFESVEVVKEMPFNLILMEELGQSLEEIFNECHRYFDLETVLNLAV